MSTIAVNSITDASGGTTASINGYTPTASNMAGKNRIINGAMMINQRNAGASVTPSTLYNTYTLDRWNTVYSVASKFSVQQNAGSVTPPVGFINYLGITSTSAYTPGSAEQFTLVQNIEGYNIADLDWGSSDAKTVTLSFWVRSSLTGTFGGVLGNSGATRTYPFTYTISAANTWEKKTITVAGDTTGTWLTTNGIGMQVLFSLGAGSTYLGTAGSWAGSSYTGATGQTSVVGTSGATFYITGVQLEVGSTATEFEHRLYTTELQLCRRYFQKMAAGADWDGNSWAGGGNGLPVSMRATPTLSNVTYPTYVSNINTGLGANGVQVLLISTDYIGWQFSRSSASRAYAWGYGDLIAEL